jgi:hypothetical protein
MHSSKIGDLPLFATVATLAGALLVAVVGLSLTIKREYLHTFVSLQTGCAYAQSFFLDNEGDDAKRIHILFSNERQWQAIRDRVREWVLSMYAAWKALMPSWFTTDLQARIPDDFMPAQALQDLNTQAPNGRRPTVQDMGLLRRASRLDTTADSSHSAGRLRILAPTHQQPSSSQSAVGVHGGATSETRGAEAVHLEEAVETSGSSEPIDGSVSFKLGNCGLGLRDMAKLRDTYNLMYEPKIWTATDERNLNLTVESAEVSKLVPSRTARHSVMPLFKCRHRRLVGACETEWAGL